MLSKYMFRKIHFIKIYDFDYINAGDIYCSPFLWFHDFFKSYSCLGHSLSSVRYDQIGRNDIVIIGGGGLINYDPWYNFNKAINKILDLCDNVILWGAGFNCEFKNGDILPFDPEIDFSRFRLYGIRDYNFKNYNYVPCASCMNPLLKTAFDTVPSKPYGSMLHPLMDKQEIPIKMDDLSHFNNIESIMEFIADHECIVTDSYHCTLWALFANRKVVSPRGLRKGNKFSLLEKKPSFCDDWTNADLLQKSMESAVSYPDFLDSSITKTMQFFEKVKEIVFEVIPTPDKAIEDFYTQSNIAEHYWKLNNQSRGDI